MIRYIGITSGFVNPLHSGHLDLIDGAIEKLGELSNYSFYQELYFIVNNDAQVKIKGSQPFMDENERLRIIEHISGVDNAILSIDKDGTVAETIAKICELSLFSSDIECKFYFFKGGDRSDSSKMPQSELDVCNKYNIEIVYGCGGFNKANSSSEILRKVRENNV